MTHARARNRIRLASASGSCHIPWLAGKPLRIARNLRVREGNPDVSVYPRRARGGLSPVAWRRLSPVEKIQVLYDLSLDAALDDLSYRGNEPHRLAARASARHDVMMICAKYAIETSRKRESQRNLEQIARELRARAV